jgi:RES domain-containing protein
MGRAKAEWMEQQERGWAAPDKFVCPDCVEDAYLKGLIESDADSTSCDYCGNEGEVVIAAPVEAIMPAVMGALTHYYAEPASAGVPYETAEGGWLFEPTDTADALMSLSLQCNDELFEDVVAAISNVNDAWVDAAGGNWASIQKSEELLYGWQRFSEHVKHRQRYFFTAIEPEPWQDIEPSRLMPELAAVVAEIGLVEQMEPDTPLFRVRLRSATDLWPLDATELGAPPPDKATAGRMNPPGISYLYLALDPATAAAEILRGPPCTLAVARFCTRRSLAVLNLTDLPEIPSLFDVNRLRKRELLLFLKEFVDAISRPVEKNGGEHVEYVPSQVVCEYFASMFRPEEPLDGLLYPSAVHPGGRNLVLFPRHEEFENSFPHVEFQNAREAAVRDWTELSRLLGDTGGRP